MTAEGSVATTPRLLLASLSSLVVLSLCSCAAPYRPLKGGTGYASAQVASNEFAVSFQGNVDTTLERAYDFALLRSAEVTLQNGFSFFSVVNITNTSSARRYTQVYRTYGAPVPGFDDFGRFDYPPGPPSIQVQQPGIYYTPGTVFLIRCSSVKPTETFAYEAAIVAQSLKRKYNIT